MKNLISCTCFLLFLISSDVFGQRPAVFPDKYWQNLTEKKDWDEAALKTLNKFIVDSSNTTGMMVIHAGKVLFQYGDVKELSYLASCRKSVLAMLYGSFVANGTIDLEKTIEELDLDDVGGLLPIEKKATIGDLLTARSGVYHPASNEGDATANAPKRGTKEPGEFWLYNNWDFNIAGHILEKETGKNIYDLVDSLLAKPLQMQDWDRKAQMKLGDKSKSNFLAYHMWFSTRDMARIGYLMLQNGKWNKQQLIPADWIETTTTIVTPLAEAKANKLAYYNFGYGYLWWIWDKPRNKGYYEGAYTASGVMGQFITVLPKLDMVIAHKTKADYGRSTSMDTYLKIIDNIVKAKK